MKKIQNSVTMLIIFQKWRYLDIEALDIIENDILISHWWIYYKINNESVLKKFKLQQKY